MSDIQDMLNRNTPKRRPLRRLVLAGIAVIALAAAYTSFSGDSTTVRYRTQDVTRGNLQVTVAASGTLAPTNQVDVGSELSGIISDVLVDENDKVIIGQVLARLDPAKLNDAITRSQATLVAAQASVKQSEATLKEAQATLARQQELHRLSNGRAPSKAEMDTAEATVARADANLASAQASVSQAEAELSSDKTDLEKATITSPINGVVLTRSIEPGQTVAASMTAPVLFTLAEDLAQMELKVNVDEADVGSVKDGQSATFTVDAYGDRKYPASIRRVSYGATTTDNVVSYLATLKVDNTDLSLRPGMTASAEILTMTRENVLLVPNAALRYAPPVTETQQSSGGIMSAFMPRMPGGMNRRTRAQDGASSNTKTIYVLENGQPVGVSVVAGASNGNLTEVTSSDLSEASKVIVGSSTAKAN